MTVNYTYFYSEDHSSSKGFWSNFTTSYSGTDDFTSQYEAARDVSVAAVVTSIYLNSIVFVVTMCTYECLRRLLPSVYSSQVKQQYKMGGKKSKGLPPRVEESMEMSLDSDRRTDEAGNDDDSSSGDSRSVSLDELRNLRSASEGGISGGQRNSVSFLPTYASLPEVVSQNWLSNVFNVSWDTVRAFSGLDGYFFLRYIRMNLRICAVTALWAFLILVPTYATGESTGQQGWYHLSVDNVVSDSWRMWVPAIFAYLFTGFVFFVMKQEYRHFLELRMDFLARGTSYISPQHHYSLMVENIPHELRSERALYDYFDQLFPGKVHSACMVMNLPDLEVVNARCMRVCRRLEKSIAFYHATGTRATHNVGSPRMSILGIELAPFDCGFATATPNVAYINSGTDADKPQKGTHVDSISYYVYDLAEMNKELQTMQSRKAEIAFVGSNQEEADNWFTKLVVSAYEMADEIMIDSAEDNALKTTYSTISDKGVSIPQAELMSTRTLYGTLGVGESQTVDQYGHNAGIDGSVLRMPPIAQSGGDVSSMLTNSEVVGGSFRTKRNQKEEELMSKARSRRQFKLTVPGTSRHQNTFRRVAGRVGLDFVVAGIAFMNHQLDHAVEGVVGSSMSSTGFITFLDLTSVTIAASTPLTSKPQILDVKVAPEPRDIIWENAHVSKKAQRRREHITTLFLVIGGFLWIFPLAAIQLFAKADYLARIPGMEWILTAGGGSVSHFVNGYLPVVALLCLIMILPVIFELVARLYEKRKTVSDVQSSMLGRYFYYQVINLYISVTAGALWKVLGDILDHPSSFLRLLGNSLPSMVGYFVAFLVTKILAGLPMVFLRIGALSKMILRMTVSSTKKLTQRELDEMYRPENVQYGWEFPAQLLVIMIVFTYAVICPVIVPFGLLYFIFSLVVYKKQILYVYQPVYESGGAMFPGVLQKTLFGLACGQVTLLAYLFTRSTIVQAVCLTPLPVITIWGMGYFNENYARPATRLSLERAREFDRVGEWLGQKKKSNGRGLKGSLDEDTSVVTEAEYGIEARRAQFDTYSYRQPVLAQKPMKPKNYRRGQRDHISDEVRNQLKQLQNYNLMDERDSSFRRTVDESGTGGDSSCPSKSSHHIPDEIVI